jgi:hypothetical protein
MDTQEKTMKIISKLISLAKHIIAFGTFSGKITDGKKIYTFSSVVLKEIDSDKTITKSLEELSADFVIYKTEEELEIDRLNDIIKHQSGEIERLVKKEKAKQDRKQYRQLSAKEVDEIENILINNPFMTSTMIVNTYNVSQPTVSRIRRGKHGLSSTGFGIKLKKIRDNRTNRTEE